MASGGRRRQASSSEYPVAVALCATPDADHTIAPNKCGQNEDGTRQEDWYEADMDQIEDRNLLRFGMEGVVDHPY